jgi:hypothetical protein
MLKYLHSVQAKDGGIQGRGEANRTGVPPNQKVNKAEALSYLYIYTGLLLQTNRLNCPLCPCFHAMFSEQASLFCHRLELQANDFHCS